MSTVAFSTLLESYSLKASLEPSLTISDPSMNRSTGSTVLLESQFPK